MNKPKNLKELLEQDYLSPAKLPKMNDFLSGGTQALDKLEGYLVFLTKKDYGALSPLMWNTLFENRSLNYRAIYFVGDPNNAEVIVDAFRTDPKYVGGGFGSGWKEEFKHLDEVRPKTLKSVNFIVRDPQSKRLIGYNTDTEGLLLSLSEKFEEIKRPGLEGKSFLILGAGGVGKELPGSLAERGASGLYLINRDIKKVEELAKEINNIKSGLAEYAGEDRIGAYLLKPGLDAVINVTKKGAEPMEGYSAFAPAEIDSPEGIRRNNDQSLELAKQLAQKNPSIVIYDITLPKSGNPKTLELAEKAGLKNLIKGVGMVVNQGVIAVERLHENNPQVFGSKYDAGLIKRIFTEATQ